MQGIQKRVERKAYRHIVLPLFIASILAFLDRVNVSYAALTMNQDLGFTAEVYGIGAGIFFAGYVIFEIPGALWAEKWSPSKWIARIMVTWGIVCMLMAFIENETQFFIYRFLLGACEASLYPVIYASVIPRWFLTADRPRAIALTLTSLQISVILGAPLAGWMVGVTLGSFAGWQSLFLLEGAITVIYGIVIFFWLKDDPEKVSWLNPEEKTFLRESLARETANKVSVQKYSVWQALTNPEVLKLCLIYFLWVTGFWGFGFWMPTVLKAASGWSNVAIGWLSVIPMVISLIAMVYIGNSSARTGEKRWHGASPLMIGSVGMLIGAFSSKSYIAYASVILAAVGVYGPFGVWWSYPTTFLTGAAAAGAIGMINSVGNIGGFIGPYSIGYLKDLTGNFSLAYIYLSGSLMLSALLMLTLKKKDASTGE